GVGALPVDDHGDMAPGHGLWLVPGFRHGPRRWRDGVLEALVSGLLRHHVLADNGVVVHGGLALREEGPGVGPLDVRSDELLVVELLVPVDRFDARVVADDDLAVLDDGAAERLHP